MPQQPYYNLSAQRPLPPMNDFELDSHTYDARAAFGILMEKWARMFPPQPSDLCAAKAKEIGEIEAKKEKRYYPMSDVRVHDSSSPVAILQIYFSISFSSSSLFFFFSRGSIEIMRLFIKNYKVSLPSTRIFFSQLTTARK